MSESSEPSFSQGIRQELLKQIPRTLSECQAVIAGFFCSAKPGKELPFATSITLVPERAEYLGNVLQKAGYAFEKSRLSNSSNFRIKIAKESYEMFVNDLSMCFVENSADQLSSSPEFRRNFLKAVFIMCGYCSDPDKAYRIELHMRNLKAVDLAIWMLHADDIEPVKSVKATSAILRFKDGDYVSDFLTLIGASNSMFAFENKRAEHEVNARVQRTYNCDLGNARRKADAGARRTDLFEKLLHSDEASSLPKELRDAALVHINNPGASIAELGRLMDPPIGKSGMNHRLIKLEEIAKEI